MCLCYGTIVMLMQMVIPFAAVTHLMYASQPLLYGTCSTTTEPLRTAHAVLHPVAQTGGAVRAGTNLQKMCTSVRMLSSTQACAIYAPMTPTDLRTRTYVRGIPRISVTCRQLVR